MGKVRLTTKKNRNKKTKNILLILCSLMAVAMLGTLFMPAYTCIPPEYLQNKVTTQYSGFQSAFGYSITREVAGNTVTTRVLKCNVTLLISYLLVACALVVSIVLRESNLATLACSIAYALACLLTVSSGIPFQNTFVDGTVYTWTLGAGTTIACSFSAAASIGMISKCYLK